MTFIAVNLGAGRIYFVLEIVKELGKLSGKFLDYEIVDAIFQIIKKPLAFSWRCSNAKNLIIFVFNTIVRR